MKIIRPATIGDSELTASNVAETDEAEYSSATTYADGDLVMVTGTAGGAATATHKIYESQAGSNTGNDPTTDDGTYWTVVSSTNRFKMFDNIVQDQTIRAGGIDVTVTTGTVVNSIGFFNVDAASIQIIMDDPTDGVVYNQTFDLISTSGIQDWYAYFFEPIVRTTEIAVTGLPPYSTADIQIIFTDTGIAKCGKCAIGQQADIGLSQHGMSLSIIDYSVKSTDASGRVTITPGDYVDTVEVDVVLNTDQIGTVKDVLTDIRTEPVVWIPEDDNSAYLVFGYYREFDVIVSNPTLSRCSLEIEGLV